MRAHLSRRYDYLLWCVSSILFATGLSMICFSPPRRMQNLKVEGPDDLTGLVAGRESRCNLFLTNPSDHSMRLLGFEGL
jgi:hypothetical protein